MRRACVRACVVCITKTANHRMLESMLDEVKIVTFMSQPSSLGSAITHVCDNVRVSFRSFLSSAGRGAWVACDATQRAPGGAAHVAPPNQRQISQAQPRDRFKGERRCLA